MSQPFPIPLFSATEFRYPDPGQSLEQACSLHRGNRPQQPLLHRVTARDVPRTYGTRPSSTPALAVWTYGWRTGTTDVGAN